MAIALAVMVLGAAAEFWLFSAAPYQGPGSEGRLASYLAFFFAGLVVIALATAVGVRLLRADVGGASTGLLALSGPLAFGVALSGGSLFLGIPLVVLAASITAVAVLRQANHHPA